MAHRHYSVQSTDIEKLNAKLLSITLSVDEKDWQSVLHTHHFTEIFYVVSGNGKFVFQDGSYSINAGDLVIVPPYIRHTEQSIPGSPMKYYVLGIDGITFQSEGEPASMKIFCNFSTTPYITKIFEQMLYEIRNNEYGSDAICQKLLEILIIKVTRTHHLFPVPSSSVRMTKECAQIKEYLDANYAEHITLDSLTSLTHMNKYYMAHSFTKYTGLSPIQYLNERRLENARHLLEETDYSVSDISSMIGFSSHSYFTQIFRKKCGMTPIKYRQNVTKKNG